MTDHAAAPGCRPALNIDVLRVLGVCRSPRELLAAMAALEARFGGCGRVKNGFATADAKAAEGFHLRVMMGNFVLDFRCTYAELAARPGVADMWAAHVASAAEGGAPRDRWRSAAAEALAMLTGDELARLPVSLLAQVGLRDQRLLLRLLALQLRRLDLEPVTHTVHTRQSVRGECTHAVGSATWHCVCKPLSQT